jgi:hypothetical protein
MGRFPPDAGLDITEESPVSVTRRTPMVSLPAFTA